MGKAKSLRSGCLADPFFTTLRRLAHKGKYHPPRLRHRDWGSPAASLGFILACGFDVVARYLI
ncbi:hypothetical protein J8I26_00235 [Herbaspirillum sp. LeCh32-8]|uniref:hypothetical protein n=1 Tax=Herbaspirillum sp. LeCh32-8 TaxID=2821356 RepID=UPI001AE61EDA|nr:hypothetical protein [Herbaspirillum sp. LeCh32-8]MBP0596520.1 hypothetical protein [Herbaspirillum sp. LeCh32-8]